MSHIITVYTFIHPRKGRPLCKSHIQAYTLWANEQWEGCVKYAVEAKNGTEAKKKAIELRLAQERLAQERLAQELLGARERPHGSWGVS